MKIRILFIVLLVCSSFVLQHCTTPEEKPKTIGTAVLGRTEYDMPSSTFSKKGFFVGSIEKLGTLLGDSSGLYHLGNDKFQALTLDPIVGIAPWRGQYILAAGPKQLMIYDGSLQMLNLTEKLGLDKATMIAIAPQDKDTLWLSTSAHLWRLRHDKLEAFKNIKDIQHIFSHVGSNYVVLQTKKGPFTVLRTNKDGNIETLKLSSDAPSFQALLPGAGTLWGLADKKLFFQEHNEGKSRWVEYPLGVTDGKNDPITHLQLTANTGQVWAIGEKFIYIVTDKQVLKTERPSSIKNIISTSAAGSSLWLSDGKKLHLFVRQASKDITYSGQVLLFMKENCWRCHQQIGPGRPLDSYELTKNNIKSIINQVETGAMPSDKKPLTGGDVNTLKQWVENKFAK